MPSFQGDATLREGIRGGATLALARREPPDAGPPHASSCHSERRCPPSRAMPLFAKESGVGQPSPSPEGNPLMQDRPTPPHVILSDDALLPGRCHSSRRNLGWGNP